MAQEKRQSFMRGAAILTASTLIVKVLGLLFSIPLANFLSDVGMTYFYNAYDIFTVLLMLSTAGLPIAVSRMVGTSTSQGRYREADRLFSVAFWLFFGIGLAGSLVMLLFARPIATFLGEPGAAHSIMALAPTLFFVSVSSAIRGYFQGRSNMAPTAVSQILEAVTKVIIGVGLAVYIMRAYRSDDMGAVGAILGVSVSSALGAGYLALRRGRQRRLDSLAQREEDPESAGKRELLITLLKFAVPITIGSCFLSLLDMLDSAVIMHRLKTAAAFSQFEADLMRTALGNARKYFDLPGAFIVPISTSLLPILSGAIASGDRKTADQIGATSVRVTLLISIPCSVGMCVFARPICDLFLPGKPQTAANTAPLLAVLSLAIALSGLLLTANAILQSFGRPVLPILTMGVGGLVKISLSYLFTGDPRINVMGSAISTVVSYLVIVTLDLVALQRDLPRMENPFKTALPILGSAVVMGVISWADYWVLCHFLPGRAAVLIAILFAVAVYAVCIVWTGVITYEDVILLPKGETLARVLRIKKKEISP